MGINLTAVRAASLDELSLVSAFLSDSKLSPCGGATNRKSCGGGILYY